MRTGLFVCLLLLLPLFGVVSATTAGGITVDESDINIVGTLENGSQVVVEVTLHNSDTSDTTASYQLSQDGNLIQDSTFVTVTASSSITVQVPTVLTRAGEVPFRIDFSANGVSNDQSALFTISDRSNLIVSELIIDPSSDLFSGTTFSANTQISNVGGVSAGSTTVTFELGEEPPLDYTVGSLPPGESVWINRTFTAPASDALLTVTANSNSNDGILESNSSDNFRSIMIEITKPPNYFHDGEITVTSSPSSLRGPWDISGSLLRMPSTGSIVVPMQVQRVSDGSPVHAFSIDFLEGQSSILWNQTLTGSMFIESVGELQLKVIIDPSFTLPESSVFDNSKEFSIMMHPAPNVVVSSIAVASPLQVQSGESVNFTVSIQNTGSIPVSGTVEATFEGESLPGQFRVIPPPSSTESGDISLVFSTVVRGDISGTQSFTATWIPDNPSHDSNLADNTATGSVQLVSDLRLRFLSDESWDNGLPLKIGVETTYSISVTSDEGSGIETFVCYAPLGTEVDRTVVNLASTGSEDTVQCTITPDKAGDLQLAIIALNGTVPSKTSLWTVIADSGESINPEEANRELGVALMILLGIAGIIVLIAAIFLTRRVMEETERETFELCPACGGEIEGDEEICPHCDFQLTSGFSRFHDCEECGTSIPSAMDHCPYCGAVQDVSSHYERRERKELVPLPDEEEDEGEDEEAILIGTEDFDDQMENFGVSEDSIEDDWESGLEEAESQIRSIEEEYEQELSSDEDEDEEIVSTNLQDQLEAGRDIDSFLAKKGKRRALKDEEVELSASDADIRKDIFDLTGEEGVLPGEKVVFDELSDPSAQVGSELQLDKTSDFSSLSSEAGHTEGISDGVEEENPKPKRRRSIRRKSKEEGSDGSQD
ncbi:MAG: CARDB domain-containing protein [Candidatus Thermoplasmatota archaeon]|nr:CARDB domain-containing protein [Candidatus Thermoplasmatota archaeon]